MPVRFQHAKQPNSLYFITFTCYKWLTLFQKANAFSAVYKWFDYLKSKDIHVTGYVIMLNHLHVLLYFKNMDKPLNTIISNAKRFMAYDIIEGLEAAKEKEIFELLHIGVKGREKAKGQVHKVFEESFDAKECYSEEFLFQKLQYIHHNPVKGK